jgi:hypothetical protein
MASLPDRHGTLQQSLYSLMNQVDTIQVALNYDAPNWIHRIRTRVGSSVTVLKHDNTLQDGARFLYAADKPGFCLVCDDDILYPPDFVQTMTRNYNDGFLTVMGKVLKPRPLTSYYKGWAKNYRTFDWIEKSKRVDIPGCCGILWHTDRMPFPLDHGNMLIPNSDVCVGVFAHLHRLPCRVIAHGSDWLKDLMPELPKDTLSIYGKYRKSDKLQTDFINKWM